MIAEIVRRLFLHLFDHVPVEVHVLANLHHSPVKARRSRSSRAFFSRTSRSAEKSGIEVNPAVRRQREHAFKFVRLAGAPGVVPGPDAVFLDDDKPGGYTHIEGPTETLDVGGGKT